MWQCDESIRELITKLGKHKFPFEGPGENLHVDV